MNKTPKTVTLTAEQVGYLCALATEVGSAKVRYQAAEHRHENAPRGRVREAWVEKRAAEKALDRATAMLARQRAQLGVGS